MRIDGTDASNANYISVQKNDTSTKDINSKNLTQLTEMDKRGELSIPDKVVIDAIERANRAILGANTKFEFSIHKDTKAIMVKVIDADTNKVIREIPSENILDMVSKFWEMSGLFVDERR